MMKSKKKKEKKKRNEKLSCSEEINYNLLL